ncbi:UNVERIFIED_CONTAM: hypothetical protein FKN15_024724 [Acipenser sinensis]
MKNEWQQTILSGNAGRQRRGESECTVWGCWREVKWSLAIQTVYRIRRKRRGFPRRQGDVRATPAGHFEPLRQTRCRTTALQI